MFLNNWEGYEGVFCFCSPAATLPVITIVVSLFENLAESMKNKGQVVYFSRNFFFDFNVSDGVSGAAEIADLWKIHYSKLLNLNQSDKENVSFTNPMVFGSCLPTFFYTT